MGEVKPKIRLVLGWRSHDSRVRENRLRMRHPPGYTAASVRLITLKKKP